MAIAFVGVLLDGSTPATKIKAVQDIVIPRGDSGTIPITVYRENGALAVLTGGAIVWTVRQAPYGSLLFARQATAVDFSKGTGTFPYSTADTIHGVDGGDYRYDIVFIDTAGTYGVAGGDFQIVPRSLLTLDHRIADDPPVVTAAPSQVALAQGPTGPAWLMGVYTTDTRPGASLIGATGMPVVIWNSDDKVINVSDGFNWYDQNGNVLA